VTVGRRRERHTGRQSSDRHKRAGWIRRTRSPGRPTTTDAVDGNGPGSTRLERHDPGNRGTPPDRGGVWRWQNPIEVTCV